MFSLSSEPLQITSIKKEGAGGFVTFEGKVRDHADGRKVIRLEYEAYPELAQSEGESLARDAIEKFSLESVTIQHRVGILEVGETAVIIQVAAAHRREAFAGCEWIIDQLKVRIPIWKRETYVDGESGWVGADAPSPFQDEEFFKRQMKLPEVGEKGQEKLALARVLLIGVGGLGSASLPYLVGGGVGTIGLVDADHVSLNNLHRQVIYQAQDVGRSKVERAANFAKKLCPGVQIEQFPVQVDEHNIDTLVKSYDWIVEGTDSLRTKEIVNAACKRWRKPLVTASVHRLEGHLCTILPDGACLNCLFPDWPADQCVGTCAESGVLGVVPGLMGVLQATEVLKGILEIGTLYSSELLLVDLLSGQMTSLIRNQRTDCPGCRGELTTRLAVECDSLEAARETIGDVTIIDVRELDEKPDLKIENKRCPTSSLNLTTISGPALIVCASGTRSYQVVSRLHAMGITDVLSLKGGISSLESK